MYNINLGAGPYPVAAPSHDEFSGQLINKPAPPPTPPSAPSSAPTSSPHVACVNMFTDWARANPLLAKCLTTQDGLTLIAMCEGAVGDPVKQPQLFQNAQNYIAAACARTAPPPPPPPTVPPQPPPPPTSNQPPPIVPPTAHDFPQQDIPVPGTPSDTSAPPAKSFLRQVGPIVGIGLLAAVGLTYARKRALTKRKRRK